MNTVFQYLQDSKEELMHKVTWPKWSELQNSAIIVIVASTLIALLIFGMDSVFGGLVKQFYQLF
jgi:preprotein translocase subunit SecE